MTKKTKAIPTKRRLRHVWTINPKTQVKKSEKGYSRPKEKSKSWKDLADDEM